jgi:hypothetical protein
MLMQLRPKKRKPYYTCGHQELIDGCGHCERIKEFIENRQAWREWWGQSIIKPVLIMMIPVIIIICAYCLVLKLR